MQFCYGTAAGIGKICVDAAPTQSVSIDAVTTIDTSNSPMCATNIISGGTGYCVVLATDITITDDLRGTGPKPLVLIASGSLTGPSLDALIDVSSKRTGLTELGAGHDPSTCTPLTTGAPKTHGGGAGGSFTGKGGAGGNGDNAANSGGTAGDAVAAVTTLRGGCPASARVARQGTTAAMWSASLPQRQALAVRTPAATVASAPPGPRPGSALLVAMQLAPSRAAAAVAVARASSKHRRRPTWAPRSHQPRHPEHAFEHRAPSMPAGHYASGIPVCTVCTSLWERARECAVEVASPWISVQQQRSKQVVRASTSDATWPRGPRSAQVMRAR